MCSHCRCIHCSSSLCTENCWDKDLLQHWLHQNDILHSFSILASILAISTEHCSHKAVFKVHVEWYRDDIQCWRKSSLITYNVKLCITYHWEKFQLEYIHKTPGRSRDLMLVGVQTNHIWRRITLSWHLLLWKITCKVKCLRRLGLEILCVWSMI